MAHWVDRSPHPARPKMKTAAKKPPFKEPIGSKSLDNVDLGREVARDLKTNFLLANFRLHPGLHDVSPPKKSLTGHCLLTRYLAVPAENGQSIFNRERQTFCDRFAALLYRYINDLFLLAPGTRRDLIIAIKPLAMLSNSVLQVPRPARSPDPLRANFQPAERAKVFTFPPCYSSFV